MKHVVAAILLLTGCSVQLDPEYQRAQDERDATIMRLANAMTVTKTDPEGCSYITSVTSEEQRRIPAKFGESQAGYEKAIEYIRKDAVFKGQGKGDTIVLDVVEVLTQNVYKLTGRLFDCH